MPSGHENSRRIEDGAGDRAELALEFDKTGKNRSNRESHRIAHEQAGGQRFHDLIREFAAKPAAGEVINRFVGGRDTAGTHDLAQHRQASGQGQIPREEKSQRMH
jgi:hypothetical protein